MLTAVKATNTLLVVDPLKRGSHALLLAGAASHMCARLDGDVRVRDRSSSELAKSSQQEAISRADFSTFLKSLLELLEDGILEDRVDDQHQSRQNTCKQPGEAVFPDDLCQSRDCAGGFGLPWLLALFGGESLGGLVLAGSHAGVYDPDRIGKHDCCGTSESSGCHGLERAQLLLASRSLEKGAGELVPYTVSVPSTNSYKLVCLPYSNNTQSS